MTDALVMFLTRAASWDTNNWRIPSALGKTKILGASFAMPETAVNINVMSLLAEFGFHADPGERASGAVETVIHTFDFWQDSSSAADTGISNCFCSGCVCFRQPE